MYSKKEVRKNAIIDAKNNLPSIDDPNFSQFEQECMAMANNEARKIMTKFEPKLEILNGKHKPLLKKYERISHDYDEHAKKIGRTEPHVELTRAKYYILMSILVLGEIPMNTIAFSVFRESQIFTWIMAIGDRPCRGYSPQERIEAGVEKLTRCVNTSLSNRRWPGGHWLRSY